MDNIVKLRTYDGAAIAGLLAVSGLFFTASGVITGLSGPAAWISVILAHVFMLIVFLLTAVFVRWHNGKDIIAVTSSLLGKPAGFLYGAALSLYFCFFTGVLIREATEILKIYALPLTPIYVVAGLLILSAVTMNLFGGQAMIKSAGFFFIIIVFGVVLILLLGVNRYNPDYLFSVLGGGRDNIAKSGRYLASMIGFIPALALLAPGFQNNGAYKKAGVIALLASAFLSTLFYLCLVMTFSKDVSPEMASGFMELAKSIYYNHFFYRFESFLLFLMIFSSVMAAAIGLYIARKSAGIIFSVKSRKTVTAACAVIAAAVVFLPANLLDFKNHYLASLWDYGVYFTAGVPLLLFAVSAVKRIFKYEN